MNFASDNVYGALPEIWTAIQAADNGTATAYGNDARDQRTERPLFRIFSSGRLWLFPCSPARPPMRWRWPA